MIHDHNPEIPNIVSIFVMLGGIMMTIVLMIIILMMITVPIKMLIMCQCLPWQGVRMVWGGKGWWLIYAPEVKRPIK